MSATSDKRYGRRGGRWLAVVTDADVAAYEAWQRQRDALAAVQAAAGEQLDLFGSDVEGDA